MQASIAPFVKTRSYECWSRGMYFGKGSNGVGYYPDDGLESCCRGPLATDIKTEMPMGERRSMQHGAGPQKTKSARKEKAQPGGEQTCG